ncbi:MAG: hypothetical protein IJS96_03770 [Schwartzia sp.]|nr:hypothetical protein [Schwartzia sp. (in: firmicutes)]
MRVYLDNCCYNRPYKTNLFIPARLRERFDYTKWRQTLADDVKTFNDLDRLLERTRDKARFNGTPKQIL